jgi:hypothetical protein
MILRTTLAAEAEVLEALKTEARRRGVSLAALLGEIVTEKAAQLRRARRPHTGIGHSGKGISQESVEREDLPASE